MITGLRRSCSRAQDEALRAASSTRRRSRRSRRCGGELGRGRPRAPRGRQRTDVRRDRGVRAHGRLNALEEQNASATAHLKARRSGQLAASQSRQANCSTLDLVREGFKVIAGDPRAESLTLVRRVVLRTVRSTLQPHAHGHAAERPAHPRASRSRSGRGARRARAGRTGVAGWVAHRKPLLVRDRDGRPRRGARASRNTTRTRTCRCRCGTAAVSWACST